MELGCELAAGSQLPAGAGYADVTLLHGVSDVSGNVTFRVRRSDSIACDGNL